MFPKWRHTLVSDNTNWIVVSGDDLLNMTNSFNGNNIFYSEVTVHGNFSLPYAPLFAGYMSVDYNIPNSSSPDPVNNLIKWNFFRHNRANCYSSDTGLFTVSMNGFYRVSGQVYGKYTKNFASKSLDMTITVNGLVQNGTGYSTDLYNNQSSLVTFDFTAYISSGGIIRTFALCPSGYDIFISSYNCASSISIVYLSS
jgi:hypothetical protein